MPENKNPSNEDRMNSTEPTISVQGPSATYATQVLSQLSGPSKPDLPDLPDEQASPAQVRRVFQNGVPVILRGTRSKLSKAEASWLILLAEHPTNYQGDQPNSEPTGLRASIFELIHRQDLIPTTSVEQSDFYDYADNHLRPHRSLEETSEHEEPTQTETPEQDTGPRPTHIPYKAAMEVDGALSQFIHDSDTLNKEILEQMYAGDTKLLDSPDLFKGKLSVLAADLLKLPEESHLRRTLGSDSVIRTHTHEFSLASHRLGARVVYAGGSRSPDRLRNVVEVVHHYAKLGFCMGRIMVHMDNVAPELTVKQKMEGDNVVIGATHYGSYPAAILGGKPTIAGNDFPVGYSWDLRNDSYNAILLAIDWDQATELAIPLGDRLAYSQNRNNWAAFNLMSIPFSSQSRDPSQTDYKFNKLEVCNITDLRNLAIAVGKLDPELILNAGWSNYCAEGQWNIDNMGPNFLLKDDDQTKERFPKLHAVIQAFQGVVQGDPNKAQEGWKAVHSAGLISAQQFRGLESTNHTGVYIDFIANDIEPWEKYKPVHADCLVGSPRTVPAMIRDMMEVDIPRTVLSDLFANQLTEALQEDQAKAEFQQAFGEPHPEQINGLAQKLAIGLQTGILSNPDFKQQMLYKMGFEFITNDNDKQTINHITDQFIATVSGENSAEKLHEALNRLDQQLANTQVEMRVFDFSDGSGSPVEGKTTTGMMRYRPPQTALYDSQKGNSVYRYIAHVLPEHMFSNNSTVQ